MVITSEYRLKKKQNTDDFYVCSKEKSLCPCCNKEMKIIGSRPRKAIQQDGSFIRIIVRRMQCVNCGRIHHELPDFLIPYKRYMADAIEETLVDLESSDETNKESDYTCEHSTAMRERIWFYRLLTSVNELPEAQKEITEFLQINNISGSELTKLQPGWLRKLNRMINWDQIFSRWRLQTRNA